MGQAFYSSRSPQKISKGTFQEGHQDRGYLEGSCLLGSMLSVSCCDCGGNDNQAVTFAQEIQTPTGLP